MNQNALTHMLTLIHRIEEWAYNYYVLDAPVVPDCVYDDAMCQLRAFEKDHPELVTPDSPTQRAMGHPVGVWLGQFLKTQTIWWWVRTQAAN